MATLWSRKMLAPKLCSITLIRSLATAPPPPRLGVDLAPLLSYCASHSTPLHPALRDLQEFTLARGNSRMMAAPEVLALNSLLIQVSGARTVLDIGVFTGASSLASALAVGEQGKVYALEKSKTYASIARKFWAQAEVEGRVELLEGPAISSLSNLIEGGLTDAVDFAFIDADKANYAGYIQLCHKLLRPGGLLALDNTLFRGHVIKDCCPDQTVGAIKEANTLLASDPGFSTVLMLCVGDGYTLAVKK